MRKPFLALLLLVGAVAMATNVASALDVEENVRPHVMLHNSDLVKETLRSRAHHLGTSAVGDTVWIAQSYSDHRTDNYWNLWAGTFLPGAGDPNAVSWDFENQGSMPWRTVGDSLNGWWPYRQNYGYTGGLTLSDRDRPWWILDFGNVVNYSINSGAGGFKRTFGVVGVWHGDPGSNAGTGMRWSPLADGKSAWCGLRRQDDNTVVDQVTGNPYNGRSFNLYGFATFASPTSNKNFPGYCPMWDQLMYRDVQVNRNQSYPLAFLYKQVLSQSFSVTPSARTGWFEGDPLSTTAVMPTGLGNLVSSTDLDANAPADSFMVYVGVPVNDAACRYSDNSTRPVFDVQRRWFSEVIKLFGTGSVYKELVSVSGGDSLAAATSYSDVIPAAFINQIIDADAGTGAGTGRMRLVFRVKTNRLFDDTNAPASFSSGTRGAALVDNVTFNGVTIGNFELNEGTTGSSNANAAVNNSTSVNALQNWKSTGKPPEVYWHVAQLPPAGNLRWDDICGPPGGMNRVCNMEGVCLSAGNKSDNESLTDSRYLSFRERDDGIISPTINLKTPAVGVNNMGLAAADVPAGAVYNMWYDVYTGGFNAGPGAQLWALGAQTYPVFTTAGAKSWSTLAMMNGFYFDNLGCFSYNEPMNQEMNFGTLGEAPDSVRILIRKLSYYTGFGVTAGGNEGCYFDNLVFGVTPGAVTTSSVAALEGISVSPWDFYNDAFPTNEVVLPTSANFDTTSANIGTGLNVAPATGNNDSFSVPGDTMLVNGAGDGVRMDLVFRILPGPGNYQIGSPRAFPPTFSQVLLQSPRNQAATVTAGDASFWGQYLADPGPFGTPHSGGKWDYLAWNSARCDTAELNIFPAIGITGGGFTRSLEGDYVSMYHESDPKFATLGILKNKCFIADTTKPVQSGPGVLNNVKCDGVIPAYLTIVPQSRTGFDGQATTREFTKIIPNRLLTPGSHVEYFFRKSELVNPSLFVMVPDTTVITPQLDENIATDGHRWQEFSVLPDRYKDSPYGIGRACILYVDMNDRRGNERQWVSVMDSIGGTLPAKYGAHNGWHAAGTDDITAPGAGVAFGVQKNSQPGTVWDMWGMKASESLDTGIGIGGRDLPSAPIGYMGGKQTLIPPTVTMAASLYRMLAVLSGDINAGLLGPYINRGSKDAQWFQSYMDYGVTDGLVRGVFVQGDGFVESSTNTGGDALALMANKFGIVLRNGAYFTVSGNEADCVDLVTTNVITTNGDIYGLEDQCTYGNDVYNIAATAAGNNSVAANFYEPFGLGGSFIASVLHNSTTAERYISLVDGWDVEHLFGRYCETDNGRLAYYRNVLINVFGTLCGANFLGASVDVPGNQPSRYVNFMKVGNSVMNRTANANVLFGVSKADRVQVRVYDVTGRLVRTLADRDFPAGNHSLVWDGRDDAGTQVARGVYFTQLRYVNSKFTSAQKLTVLK